MATPFSAGIGISLGDIDVGDCVDISGTMTGRLTLFARGRNGLRLSSCRTYLSLSRNSSNRGRGVRLFVFVLPNPPVPLSVGGNELVV